MLLAAGSIVVGALTIYLGVLGTLGARPEAHRLELAEPDAAIDAPPMAVMAERVPDASEAPAAGAARGVGSRAMNGGGVATPDIADPARPTRTPGCEAAVASLVQSLGAASLRRCARGTGVTTGDRLQLRLVGSAGARLEVKVAESSGSREFDACLVRALAGRRLPARLSPARCQKQLAYRVP